MNGTVDELKFNMLAEASTTKIMKNKILSDLINVNKLVKNDEVSLEMLEMNLKKIK
jgi:hypothetical protein